MINDAHIHFFSSRFFATLAGQRRAADPTSPPDPLRELGWDDPGPDEALADRWVQELDRHGVARAALIGSAPGEEVSVAAAVARHPSRFVGFFMLDASAADASERAHRAITELGMRGICLFPAMHHVRDGRRPRDRHRRDCRRASRHRGVRALRRAVDWRAPQARTAQPLRRAPRRPARPEHAGARMPDRTVHRPALRRRAAARSADAG